MQGRAEIIRVIRENKRFLISSHVNPEGDSLGSALALRGLLVKLRKKVEVIWDGPVPEAYRFLPGTSSVRGKPSGSYDAAFIVDCPTLKRIGLVQRFIVQEKPLCVIDHHISNERFGTVNWIDPRSAAVGEMIVLLFQALKVKMDLDDATNLYVSIVTDTGSFRYSNTTARVHALVSKLIGLGVRPAPVTCELYESYPLSSRRLLAEALKTLTVEYRGKMAWIEVTQKMISACKSSPEETEGIVDFARSLKGVRVAVFFREEENGEVKVSFRSKGSFNVDRIASHFGGGGHRAASGCVVRKKLKEAEELVLKEVRKALARDGK